MRFLLAAAIALLSIGAASAQSAIGPIAGKSIVFTLSSDQLPFVLYTAPSGKVFLAVGFAGEEFRCGWRGRFGLEGQIDAKRPASTVAKGPGCTFTVKGLTAADYKGGQLRFVFTGSGTVTGEPAETFLGRYTGKGSFPIQLAVVVNVSGSGCKIATGGSIIGGHHLGWPVTSCNVRAGNAIR
jgi:hypothetical protein